MSETSPYTLTSSSEDAEGTDFDQANMHHRLFYRLFKAGTSPSDVKAIVPRLLGMIERRIPIHYPTTLRDITQVAMQKFFLDDWKPGSEVAMSSLLNAYVKAGYISLTAIDFQMSLTSDKKGMLGGTVLQHAIVRCAPVVVRSLFEAGADPRIVPDRDVSIRSGTQHALGSMLDVKKGDALAFAEAYHEPGSEVPLLVRSALMHLAIEESSPMAGRATLVPEQGVTEEAKLAAIEVVAQPSTTTNHRRLGL